MYVYHHASHEMLRPERTAISHTFMRHLHLFVRVAYNCLWQKQYNHNIFSCSENRFDSYHPNHWIKGPFSWDIGPMTTYHHLISRFWNIWSPYFSHLVLIYGLVNQLTAGHGSRAVWGMYCLPSLGSCGRGFESRTKHGCLVRVCVYSVFVLWLCDELITRPRSPTVCKMIMKLKTQRPGPKGAVEPVKKKQLINYQNSYEQWSHYWVVIQLIKKFHAFCVTRMFITVLKRADFCSLFWVRGIRSTPSHHIILKSF
jgi:hypothetical protein